METRVLARRNVLPAILRYQGQRVDLLALRLGYRREPFSMRINGSMPTPREMAVRIAQAVGWPVEELFVTDSEPDQHPIARRIREAAVASDPLTPDVAAELHGLIDARTADAA